jgi:hypothetical protein
LIEGAAVGVLGCAQRGRRGWVGAGELGQAGLQQSGVDVDEQCGVVAAGAGEPVAVTAGHADDARGRGGGVGHS